MTTCNPTDPTRFVQLKLTVLDLATSFHPSSPVIFVILLILSAWPNHLKQVLLF